MCEKFLHVRPFSFIVPKALANKILALFREMIRNIRYLLA
jgi:hypothetical protein